MPSPPRCAGALATSLLLLVAAGGARAERLFVRLGSAPEAGIARVATLALDVPALARVRGKDAATVDEFPLGSDGTATLALERFTPFADGARAEVVEGTGAQPLALPDQLYYRGRVAGDPDSRVLLVATADAARGFVATDGTVYRFGRDRTGAYRSWALRDADPALLDVAPATCLNDRYGDLLEVSVRQSGATAAPPALETYAPTLLAEVALETDQELRALFASNTAALAYLADLAASVSAIYDADVGARIVFRSIRLWNTADPWTATNPLGMLYEVRDWWNLYEAGTPRDIVHFVSGKGVQGGIAYLGVLCWPEFGYGVSTVYGAFDVMSPADTWDVVVVAHEFGHNFGSPHTHCYDPLLDTCYSGESGCYTGPTSVPPEGGTIMSYCHLRAGGMKNVNLTFGPVVSAVLRTGAEAGTCLGAPCGDGQLDPGEECDDGNVVDGDCCSSTCTIEPDGGGCDDGKACTTGGACASGVCVGTPVADGTPCDVESLCAAGGCVAGECVGVPAPGAGCKVPTVPRASQLVMKDRTPDKGDQVAWKWAKGEATELADFGDPLGSDDYELCVYTPGPGLLFKGRMPAGGTCGGRPCWRSKGTAGFAYQSKDRLPEGMVKAALKAGADGAARVQASGKGAHLGMPALGSLPLPLRVQLRRGDRCWEATFSTPRIDTAERFSAKSD